MWRIRKKEYQFTNFMYEYLCCYTIQTCNAFFSQNVDNVIILRNKKNNASYFDIAFVKIKNCSVREYFQMN